MRIVILDGYTLNPGDLSWNALKKHGSLTIHDRTAANEVIEKCRDAQIILTNKVPINAEAIKSLKHLEYIGVTATGYNIIDVETANDRGIIVTNVPGYSTASVAQLCFAFMLEFTHHVQRHSDVVMSGKWASSPDFCFWDFPLIELAGKTMGIIGFGSIGQKVADLAAAFDMKVLAHSRTQSDQSDRKDFRWVELNELLKESDFVSIHCPLTPETRGLMNRDTLSMMKNTAFLINTSRGPIVLDTDLADALNDNIIAGAGIDVLSVEPPHAGNPLFGAKNCFITPHIGWASKEARERLMDIVVGNIEAFINKTPKNVITGA